MFFRGSRYETVSTAELTDEHGRVMQYKQVRFFPQTGARLGHLVGPEERLDEIAHHYYGDPERFWRICDANRASWPAELTQRPGRTLLIPPAEG